MANSGHKPVVPFTPTDEHRKHHPLASRLREEGYVPLPRLWVKAGDMEEIYRIVARHTDDVIRIRREVYAYLGMTPEEFKASKRFPEVSGDPIADKEAAWAAFERDRMMVAS